jgi:FkbM family methyltransferase
MKIARTVNQLIRPLGVQITRTPKPAAGTLYNSSHARTDPFFDCLVKLGFKPKHFVDVGANKGNWTRTALKYFPDAYFSMFEPQATMRNEVADLTRNERVKFYCMGAGPSNSTMKLTVLSRDDSFTFALDEAQASTLGFAQVEAPVVALDDFLPKTGSPPPDVLKIDAEGWDLQVLIGARRTLRNCEVVLLEAAIMNKGFTNRIDVAIAAMKEEGYVVFDITDLNRTVLQNALWLVEIAFVRQGGMLDSQVTRYS